MPQVNLRSVVCVSCFFAAASAPAQMRNRHVDARVSATLDEIAARPESRVAPIAPPRFIHEPGRAPLRRGTAPVIARRSVELPRAAATSPVSYTGFAGLLDNFTSIPPDTTGAVGPK